MPDRTRGRAAGMAVIVPAAQDVQVTDPHDSDFYDLVVVGAGPAGSATALRALQLRPDARVLLLDKADFPRDKACGDGIAPHGIAELCGLGVPEAVDGYRPVGWLRIRSPGGAEVAAPPARANYVVPREVFDARLVAAAVARGATLSRHKVRRVEPRDAHVVVDGDIAGRVVVGADGANSVVRRQLGLGPNPPDHLAIAVRGYAPAPDSDPAEQLIAMDGGGWPAYAWSFPIGDGRANIGFGKLVRRLGEDSERSGRAQI